MTDKLNLIDTIAKIDKFSTFSRVLGTSGASEVISGEGEFTVFVPTNDAFCKIHDKRMNELLSEPQQIQLKAMLTYHILPEKVMAANLPSMIARKSVTGEEIGFSDSNGLKVNGAGVQARNIEATNGVIHQIDTVLTAPPSAAVKAAFAASNADTLPMGTQAETPTPITPAAKPAAVTPTRITPAATVTTAPLSTSTTLAARPEAVTPTPAAAILAAAPSKRVENPIF